jgi:D-3-phosphoglycerate dehydrogenase
MKVVRIGLPDDLLNVDGSMAFPDYSMGDLLLRPGIEIMRIGVAGGLRASTLKDLDILLSVPHGPAITRAALAGVNRLTAIVRVGVGYDDVDVNACSDNDVLLAIPSEATKRPTAVAALTLILALATRLMDKDRLTRAGTSEWHRRASLRGQNLEGKILGLIGCGNIGRELIEIARPLGMRFLVNDPKIRPAAWSLPDIPLVSLDHLLSQADFVSVNCPLTKDTRHLLDAERIGLMKPTAYLVNTARGGIIDQRALTVALSAGRIAGAGLDVFEDEPPQADDPLLGLNNVVLSAHALNWTIDLDRDLSASNVRAIKALLNGWTPEGVVNPDVLDRPRYRCKLERLQKRVAES